MYYTGIIGNKSYDRNRTINNYELQKDIVIPELRWVFLKCTTTKSPYIYIKVYFLRDSNDSIIKMILMLELLHINMAQIKFKTSHGKNYLSMFNLNTRWNFLLVARCSLVFACWSLIFARCLLLLACCSLLFVRCLLPFARCL